MTFTAFNWREELIRAKPTSAHPQGNVYPVLANAITALRHSPEWQGVLAFNELLLTPMAIKPARWGPISNTAAWSDHEDRLTAEWLQRKGILVDVGTGLARIYRPGVKADCCLILEGPQGSKNPPR